MMSEEDQPWSQTIQVKRAAFAEAVRRFTYISCWHMNEHESAAMWSLYARDGRGVAVRSTFQRLKASLSTAPETVSIGVVKYIDYTSGYIDETNFLAPFIHKRLSFQHERELRAIILRRPEEHYEENGHTLPGPNEGGPTGMSVAVALKDLVTSVYVHPDAPTWFSALVLAVARKYDLPAPVETSKLAARPVF